ncbi:paraquat-inducible protein B [Methylohalomonas lacus]|uniref:Paraquat-inducible protein B n=1 Tax=Methylohalomonas lacus TaxID=398773 RepID=A0AAE3HMV3_9GAMM|nr:intermembrane transport protein PqiB [Methylohalomonas lacus]MCS3904111.1 paraquat-inducible protein B [Methylohalomonas lacus]
MSDTDLTQAKKKPRRRALSSIWIVPIIAIAIGGWMVYYNISTTGPRVILEMNSADGIQAGKTLIKARNVEVGKVESMRLSDDHGHVIITAQMNKDSERLLKSDTRFWVVKPRIGREGISGLGTLWSGAYIELMPGQEEQTQRRFEVLEEPPIAKMHKDGLRVKLHSENADRLSVGDPVIYSGFDVGRIESADFKMDDRQMHYRIFIDDKYRDLVTENTRFWSASGVSLELNAGGMQVDMGTLESVIGGGITFGVPEDLPPGDPVGESSVFTLYDSENSAYQASFDKYLEYVMLVDDTVRSLSPDAAVEYRGVRIGTVIDVPYEFTPERVKTLSDIKIPVLIRIEPQRLDPFMDEDELVEWRQRYQRLFANGLRASLKTGNFLTGSSFVDIGFYADATAMEISEFVDKPVFPSVPSRLSQLDQRLSQFMDKINNLEIEALIEKLDSNLGTSEAMLKDLRELSSQISDLLESEDMQALPGDIRSTLDEINETLDGAKPGAPAYEILTDTLKQLQTMMNDFQPFVETLNKQPNALIFNKLPEEDPQPKASPGD